MRMQFTAPGCAGVSAHSETSSARTTVGIHTHGVADASPPQAIGLRHTAPDPSRSSIQAAGNYDITRITSALKPTAQGPNAQSTRSQARQLLSNHGLGNHWTYHQNTGPNREWDVLVCADPRQSAVFYCPATGQVSVGAQPSQTFFTESQDDLIQP